MWVDLVTRSLLVSFNKPWDKKSCNLTITVFGNVAHEITGKKVFNPNSAHTIVIEALEKNRSAEALARRLWMSFVVEGKNSLFQEDILEVLSGGRRVLYCS